ncbi:uncharacterized protein DEA37_0010345 [Paragonimus westermani]|uniref:Uncharacterized protein n=1 Tax=Paragonimus westermani TaxID=34504 RepID=A0A5J4NDC5_9TREM|nr:uncharacterized protein DEA37_0010345 [Paragonimus westermani]
MLEAQPPKARAMQLLARIDQRTRRQINAIARCQRTGRRLAKSIGAVGYLECSAKLNSGVKEVFNTAIQCGLDNRVNKPKKHRCALL